MGKFLKAKTKKDDADKNNIFIGTYVSDKYAQYLSLFCVAKSISKTQIVRTLFENWFNANANSESKCENKLFTDIAKKAINQYYENKAKTNVSAKKYSFENFINVVEVELMQKGISNDNIANIVTIIKALNEKNKKRTT